MSGSVSTVCGLLLVTAALPSAAACVGTVRIKDAKTSTCYSGTLNVININLKYKHFLDEKRSFSLKIDLPFKAKLSNSS